MKFSGKVGKRLMKQNNDFRGDPDHGSGSRIRIRIATLVRRALAEVCTVLMLLVYGRPRADDIFILSFVLYGRPA